jgi:hypothetical protein
MLCCVLLCYRMHPDVLTLLLVSFLLLVACVAIT